MKQRTITNKINKHKKPEHIGYADFETVSLNSGKAYVFAIGFILNEYYEFYIETDPQINDVNIQEKSNFLIKCFIDKCQVLVTCKITIYFHNLSSFDGYFLTNFLIQTNEKFNIIIRNNRILKLSFGKLTFLDSMLMLNDNLNNIALTFIGKSKGSIDPIFTIERIMNDKTLILIYLKNDVMILKESFDIFINKIWDQYSVNVTRCLTIPSLSFTIFRKFFQRIEIDIPIQNIYNFVKKSYNGGVCDVLLPYGENLYLYDINSLYPYSMLTNLMPVKFVKWLNTKELKMFELDFNNFYGFVHLKIQIPDSLIIGPLGVKKNGKLIFPVGIITGVFFSEEIKFALSHGATVLKIYSGVQYNCEYIFSEFVIFFYSKKKSSHGFEKFLYKLLLNSLYGRFGMHQSLQECVRIPITKLNSYIFSCENVEQLKNYDDNNVTIRYTYERNSSNETKFKSWGNDGEFALQLIRKLNKKLNLMNSCVAISSAISSYSRIRILSDIYKFSSLGKIFYVDTDSLVTDFLLPQSECSDEIGHYKLEYKKFTALFLTPKIYILKETKSSNILKIAFKGVSREFSESLIWDWFYKQYINNNIFNKFNLPQSIKKVFSKFEIFTNQNRTYTPYLFFDKRIKVYKGGVWVSTKPLRF